MSAQKIIMNFVPPSYDDIITLGQGILDDLPEELDDIIGDVALTIEDLADEILEDELDLDDAFELLILFKHEKEISPGVERKQEENNGTLTVFRRPVLDEWCESGEDLAILLRHLIIEELGRVFDFEDDDIEDMTQRHHQGLL
jgi:predicted Zn-dependent protease with MMP-like domain